MMKAIREQLMSAGFESSDDEEPGREPGIRIEHRNLGDAGLRRGLTDEGEEIAAKDKARLVRNGWEFSEDLVVIELD